MKNINYCLQLFKCEDMIVLFEMLIKLIHLDFGIRKDHREIWEIIVSVLHFILTVDRANKWSIDCQLIN